MCLWKKYVNFKYWGFFVLHVVDYKPVIGGYAIKINNIFHVLWEIRNEKYILSPLNMIWWWGILSKVLIINTKKGQPCPFHYQSTGCAYGENETLQLLEGLRKLEKKKKIDTKHHKCRYDWRKRSPIAWNQKSCLEKGRDTLVQGVL